MRGFLPESQFAAGMAVELDACFRQKEFFQPRRTFFSQDFGRFWQRGPGPGFQDIVDQQVRVVIWPTMDNSTLGIIGIGFARVGFAGNQDDMARRVFR